MILQLKREVEIQSRLVYKGIARLYGVFQTEKSVYMVMEYIKGKTIFELMADRSFLDEYYVRNIVLQVCGSIAYLEKRSVMHRDLKLENLMITEEGLVKLIDFGWAVHAPNQL